MKTTWCFALLLWTSIAAANELSDANALFEKKAYAQALQAYSKLANAGNAEAQLHLGEMYWYGEAGAIDLEKARNWFTLSAAQGNKAAASALDVMRRREERKADIAYWVGGYDGADLKAGQFNCARPAIPDMSINKEDILKVNHDFNDWQRCYNGFVANLNSMLPPGKRIPADVAKLLNEDEYNTAIARLDKLYAGISRSESDNAQRTVAAYTAWQTATENALKVKRNAEQAERDSFARQRERAGQSQPVLPPPVVKK